MNLPISSAFTMKLRVVGAMLALLAFCGGSASMQAQSLKFAPVLYGVEAVNEVQANNVNALSGPTSVAVDPLGNLYILDAGHSQIRKVDPTGTGTVFAGIGVNSYTGDGGQAIKASFYYPSAIATDGAGNVYVADTYAYAIRRIDAVTGIITTVAGGNGVATGVVGDNGPATSAKLVAPYGVAVDASGNIYIADGAVVRRVDASGTITTFAGGGSPTSGNGDGGVATSASLVAPYGLSLDNANHLYIADYTAGCVRVVNTTNSNIATFAGVCQQRGYAGDSGLATAALLNQPRAVSADNQGNVYIADVSGYIRVVNSSNIISTFIGNPTGSSFAGDGSLPLQANITGTYGVAADINGNVYFSSQNANKVYKVVTHPERFPMTSVGKTSPPQRIIIENTGPADISYTSIAVSGDFAITTAYNPYVSSSSPCSTTTGSHTIQTGFNNYCELDVTFTPTAAGIRSFPITVTSNDTPTTLTENLTSTGMASTLATTGGQIFTIGGQYNLTGVTGDGGQATASTIVGPDGLVTDSAGNVYFVEYASCRVRKIDAATGVLTTIAGINPFTCNLNAAYNQPDGPAAQAELYSPSAIAIDTAGSLYIADSGHNQIRKIVGGQIIRIVGTGAGCSLQGNEGPAIDAQICGSSGIVVDHLGNIYFTDSTLNVIRKVDTSGTIHVIAGNTASATAGYSADGTATSMTLSRPWGIALDNTEQNLIYVENGNNIVRKLNFATGKITTIAGRQSLTGYAGDGGLATSALLLTPYGVATDAANDIYIADSGNNVVRKIDGATGIITTVAGNFVLGDLYNGEGVPATGAGLDYPEEVTVDSTGYLILSERSPLIREVSPNGSLNFGNQQVSTTSAAQTVTISNIGNTPMMFSSPAYGVSGDFAFVPGGTCTFTGSLAVGSSCTVQVNFTPTATGYRYGLLAYYDNGVASPQLTQLRGMGTAPAQPVAQTISLTNPGAKGPVKMYWGFPKALRFKREDTPEKEAVLRYRGVNSMSTSTALYLC